jgi:hypothetical protein
MNLNTSHQDNSEYLNELLAAELALGKRKLKTLEFTYREVLAEFPKISSELTHAIEASEALDFDDLAERIDKSCGLVSTWLAEWDKLPKEIQHNKSLLDWMKWVKNNASIATVHYRSDFSDFNSRVNSAKREIQSQHEADIKAAEASKSEKAIAAKLKKQRESEYVETKRITAAAESEKIRQAAVEAKKNFEFKTKNSSKWIDLNKNRDYWQEASVDLPRLGLLMGGLFGIILFFQFYLGYSGGLSADGKMVIKISATLGVLCFLFAWLMYILGSKKVKKIDTEIDELLQEKDSRKSLTPQANWPFATGNEP